MIIEVVVNYNVHVLKRVFAYLALLKEYQRFKYDTAFSVNMCGIIMHNNDDKSDVRSFLLPYSMFYLYPVQVLYQTVLVTPSLRFWQICIKGLSMFALSG